MVDYLSLQQKLKTRQAYRAWWVFWANYSILPIVFVYASIFKPGAIGALALVLTALVIRFVLVSLINFIDPQMRPYQIHSFTPVRSWFNSEHLRGPTSFPSAHLAVLTVVFSVWLFSVVSGTLENPNLTEHGIGLAMILVCLVLTAAGRVILGYHFVRDVVGGFLISLVASPLIWTAFSYVGALIFL